MSEENREVNKDILKDPELENDLEAMVDNAGEPTVEETKEEETTEEVVEEPAKETEEEVKPTETSPDGLKKVQGETPKERALRAEVTRLKRERREAIKQDNFEEKEIPTDDTELESMGYTKEEITNTGKLFDIMADRKGYVKKDQSYKSMANETLDTFVEENSEYAPENDTDDIRWSRFNEILKSDYNIKGKTQKQLTIIFNKINRDVKEELGEVEDSSKKVNAQKQKVGSVSAGASTTTSKQVKPAKIQSVGGTHNIGGIQFKGFDDDDFGED